MFRESFIIYLWYNGFDIKEAVCLSYILNGDKFSKYEFKEIPKMRPFQKKGFYTGWIEEVRFETLSKKVVENLKKLDFFANIP